MRYRPSNLLVTPDAMLEIKRIVAFAAKEQPASFVPGIGWGTVHGPEGRAIDGIIIGVFEESAVPEEAKFLIGDLTFAFSSAGSDLTRFDDKTLTLKDGQLRLE